MKKLNSWFEIDEKQYMWYILQGYHISVGESAVMWKLDGKLHRTNGPAFIWGVWADGSRTHEWYINGTQYTEEQFNEIKRNAMA